MYFYVPCKTKIRSADFADSTGWETRVDSRWNFLTSLGLTTPGVSLKTSWVSPWVKTALEENLVVWAFFEWGQAVPPTNLLTRVLLPAFGIPEKSQKYVKH